MNELLLEQTRRENGGGMEESGEAIAAYIVGEPK